MMNGEEFRTGFREPSTCDQTTPPARLWQLCRICATIKEQMIPIFQDEGKKQNLADKIKKYLPIMIDESDRLPLQVCKACTESLEICHDLNQCCSQADSTLRRLLQEEEKMGMAWHDTLCPYPENRNIVDGEVPRSIEDQVPSNNGLSYSCPRTEISLQSQPLTRTRQQQKNNSLRNRENDASSEDYASKQYSVGGKNKQFSCWECGVSLEDLHSFVEHQKSVHFRELRPCQLCGNLFETEHHLNKHWQEEHFKQSKVAEEGNTVVDSKEQIIPIISKRIRKKAASPKFSRLQRSVRITRASAQRNIPKPILRIKENTEEKQIINKIEISNVKLECNDEESLPSYDNLDTDESYIPDEKAETKASAYKCKLCSKGYESKSGRRHHYIATHDRHECKVCEELFLTSEEAELHAKQPHKIACILCPEYFQSQSSLKMHVSSKHLEGPKQFKCSQCGRDYVSKSALLTHEKLHKIKEPSICDVCNKSCKTPTALKYHKFVHMTDEEKAKVGFACTMCEKKFPGKTRLTLHMRRHTDERPCECPTCHKTFHDSERLKAHMEGHSTEKRFKCDQCDACFVSKRYLVNHMYLSHRRRQVIRCVVCKIVFPSMKEVMNHQRTHTSEEVAQSNCGNQPFTKSIEFHCKECNEYFSKRDTLRLHKARFHAKERIPHKSNVPIKQLDCKVCGKKVWGTAGLSRHMRLHTGEAPARTFQCEFCAKLFAQKMQMVLHIRTHTGEKPYRCQFCDKGFINVNSLVVHERIHTGENPFQCDKCPKAFRSNSNLVAHLQTHSDVKPYECHYCHKRFGRLIHLKLHLRTHTGERPYVCDICGRAFTQGGDMRKHRLTHTGERAYKCELCDFSSNKRKSLNEHQLLVHPNARHVVVLQSQHPPPLNSELHQLPSPQLMHVENATSAPSAEYPTQPSSSYLKIYENWNEN